MFRAVCLLLVLLPTRLSAADWSLKENPNLATYFENEVTQIEQKQSLFRFQTLDEWQQAKVTLRSQLFDMLGFSPDRERPPLEVKQTGVLEEEEFRVEKLWIQTMPGLYLTASYYVPKNVTEPLPTILYVCGHARMKADDGASLGNKTGYQHHGAWFARNGYTCLTIDTVQLGEIEGIHHGTYRHNRWWWNSRGYTPAGVEAWNCIRALDYLETRDEVDSERFGVTGRSGGGAYSWWISALDERIKCAVPVAGITSLRNHVIDGCVEGHCDCMYMVNTFRWDYATVAALMAPRPLLISNSDKDRIFPLDGVVEVHRHVRHIYDLYEKPNQLGLQITEGPHRDTQELRVHAFRWFNRWLKNDDSLIDKTATKFFEPSSLKVFTALPGDERNTSIDEDFAPQAPQASQQRLNHILQDQKAWATTSIADLRERSFAAWPADETLADIKVQQSPLTLSSGPADDRTLTGRRLQFQSQEFVPVSVDVICADGGERQKDAVEVCLLILNDTEWSAYRQHFLSDSNNRSEHDATKDIDSTAITVMQRALAEKGCAAVFCPRGIGVHAWKGDTKKQIQIRRRFQLIGTTVDAMRTWDIRAAIHVVRENVAAKRIITGGVGHAGWLALTASLFEGNTVQCSPAKLAVERDSFPVFLNAARHFSPEELFALCLSQTLVDAQDCDERLLETQRFLTSDRRWTGATTER